MKLKNLMEDEVFHAINRLLEDEKHICTCDKCKLDIAAIALNRLKPKYVVTEKGTLYAKADRLNYQYEVDVVMEITRAIKIVGANPHHER